MNSASAKKPLDLLFVGPSRLVENIQSAIPNHWHARFVESFEEFFKNPEDVTRILDASIREVLDLGVKEFRLVRHVACASTGTNHIKHRLNDEEPVKVSSLRDIPDVLNTLTAAAEFSFGLLISLARNIVHSSKSVESGTDRCLVALSSGERIWELLVWGELVALWRCMGKPLE